MATSLAICKIFEQVYKILLQDVSDFDASQPASFLQEPYVWVPSIVRVVTVVQSQSVVRDMYSPAIKRGSIISPASELPPVETVVW